MRHWPLVPLTVLCAACLTCAAQSAPVRQGAPTPENIEAQLKGPFLMLRGMYDGHKLDFDAQGNLVGRADLLPFSLSALRLGKVKVTDSTVEIDTTREGLDFQDGVPKAELWGRGNRLRIYIARDAQHPDELDAALAKVLSVGLDQAMRDHAPDCWRPYLEGGAGLPARFSRAYGIVPTPGGTVTAPRVLYAQSPNDPITAREDNYSGLVVVGLIVDANGSPREVHIVRPVGMGLDEAAVESVEHYKFAPATQNGRPVPVQINIEVNFRMR